MDEDKYVILDIYIQNKTLNESPDVSLKECKEAIQRIKDKGTFNQWTAVSIVKADSEEYHQRKAELELIRVLL